MKNSGLSFLSERRKTMRKENITYTDYNGEIRSEDYYFNMSKADVMKLEMTTEGGMEGYINKIINERDQKKIVDLFCDIIEMSYGIKTLDGGFDKDPAHFKKFKQTEAYSELFMKLATDADYAAEFINGIMPNPAESKPVDRNEAAVERAKREAAEKIAKLRPEVTGQQ